MAAVFPVEHRSHDTPIGSMERLEGASRGDVISFFRDWYAPNNAVLTIAGDVTEAEGFAAAERWFGPIPAKSDLGRSWPIAVPPVMGQEYRETVPDRVPLVRVHVGYRIPPFGTAEYDALSVATQILAGGRGSRLYHRLVRDERVAQDVAAFPLDLVGGASILAGWVTARPESDAATVERVWHEETDRLASEPVSDDELARARALIESSEMGALSRVEEVADRLSQYATYFDRPELINEQLARYLAVDAAAIQAAAAAVFRPDNRAVITYVPAGGEEEAAA
jgi:predicted Zn-dependent peptidase